MCSETQKIEKPNLLVVEGQEEKLVFGVFLTKMGLENEIQIMPIGGKTQLRQNLKALALSPGFSNVSSLGIVRDADEDPSSAFQSVQDALRQLGLPVPNRPLMPEGSNPRVIIMILPAPDRKGALEELCLDAVIQDPAMVCVQEFFECLTANGISLPRNLGKAKIQVFLASRPRAGLQLGQSFQAGYWSLDSPAFDGIKQFLRILVDPYGLRKN